MIPLSATDSLSASAGTAAVITFTAMGDTVVSGVDNFGLIAQGTLGSSAATVVPTNASPRLIKTLTLVNTSASIVPNIRFYANGTAASNRIFSLTLPANGSAVFDASGLAVYDAAGSLLTFGLNGRGISTITLTNTTGNVDTYTITYSDSSTSTYTVTNGVSPTATVGATTVVNPNVNPSVTDADAGANLDLRFNLPRAVAVAAGTTTTGAPGSSATVAGVVSPSGDLTLNFTVPRGDTGPIGPTGPTGATGATGPISEIAAGAGITVGGPTGPTATVTNADRGSTAVTAHEALLDPHPQYLRETEVTSGLGLMRTVTSGVVNLVGSLSSTIFYAGDYGSLTDGSDAATVAGVQATANRNTIQAAINAASSTVAGRKPGGYVLLPPGTFHIDATLTINTSSVQLIGSGRRGNTDVGSQTGTGTTLFWNSTASPATTAMIDVVSVQGAANAAVKGSGVSSMNLQCAGNVGVGIRIKSLHWAICRDLYIINATAKGFLTECFITGTELGEAADVTKCTFENIGIRMLEVSGTAVGFSLEGSSNANTSNSTFRNLAVSCQGAQLALDIRNTDSNRFYDVVINQSNGGTVQPAVLRGGASEALASRGNMFFGLATGGSSTGVRGLKSEGTDTAGVVAAAMNNRIWGYSIENGEPAPLVGTGSVLQYQLVGGASALSRTAVIVNATTTTETVIARWLLPENFFYPRNDVVVEARGQVSGTATVTYRIRIGTAGTIADPIAGSCVTAAGVANAHTGVRANLECLTSGAAGTLTASLLANMNNGVASNTAAAFAAATANTSARLFVSISVQQSAAQTYTTRVAKIIRED